MSAELVASAFLIAYLVIMSVVVYRVAKKKETQYLALIPSVKSDLKNEVESIFQEKLQGAIDAIGESLGEMFTQPTVKKAFSIIGSQGGQSKADSALVDQMAGDILNSPQFSALKLGASALGLDLESYIEENGATKTIAAAQQLSKLLGIDFMKMDLAQLVGSLSRPGGSSPGDNPYLRR